VPPVRKRAAKRPARTRRPSSAVRPAKSLSHGLTSHKHKVLAIHGDSGIGKTRLLGTLDGKKNLLIRSPVDHVESMLTAGLGGNFEERVVSTWEEMDDDIKPWLRQDGAQFGWVCVDTLPLLQDVLMDDIWALVLSEKKDRYRYGLDKQEHGINQLRLGGWMRDVIGCDLFNFVWTAHSNLMSSPDQDEEGEALEKLMPSVHGGKGALAVKFCGYSTFVGYYRKSPNGKHRVLHTDSSPVYYAKNQYSPDGRDWAMVDPTMPELIARMDARGGASARKRGSRRPRTPRGR
jgi:hypothetical protein